ncbi:asparagine synthase-related protein [Streptomyces harbinensis]|uniref:asparagine synthase-related protein n=1 Tax=Streptomyces harbinensis TaxID=1176198 RepID=UPI0036B2B73C
MEFVVLPDGPAAAAVGARLLAERPTPTQIIPHASGRPWIIGRFPPGEVVQAEAGQRRIALIGATSVAPETLRRALERARSVRDLDTTAGSLPGSFHLVASFDGRVRVQGSVSAIRQVFRATVSGTVVAADRPQPLRRLTGAALDETSLALQLVKPLPPWPLTERSLWQGIERLAHDHYLELSQDGQAHERRWWHPPEPEVPLTAGAATIRMALQEAVAVRTRGGGTVSADLSGGMDSTSISFLAAEGPARLITTRWEAEDPANDDRQWATRAARSLPDAQHQVFARETIPACFTGILAADADAGEAPFEMIRTRAQLIHHARATAELGSTRHLSGDGGDELFYALPIYLHTVIRTAPLTAVRQLRTHRALYRWKRLPLLASLSDRRSFARWLASTSETLTAAPPRPTDPDSGWASGTRAPAWVTDEAVGRIRDVIRETAVSGPEPLAPLRGQHFALQAARHCGGAMRRAGELTSRHGLPLHAPFLDDRVIEAALSVRFVDRGDPGAYKPALAAAMRGIVPDGVLGRPTKAEFSAEVYHGLRANRRDLAELCEDMSLARAGLIDPAAFRSALLGLHPVPRTLIPLEGTLASESWLRSVSSSDSTPAVAGGKP